MLASGISRWNANPVVREEDSLACVVTWHMTANTPLTRGYGAL